MSFLRSNELEQRPPEGAPIVKVAAQAVYTDQNQRQQQQEKSLILPSVALVGGGLLARHSLGKMVPKLKEDLNLVRQAHKDSKGLSDWAYQSMIDAASQVDSNYANELAASRAKKMNRSRQRYQEEAARIKGRIGFNRALGIAGLGAAALGGGLLLSRLLHNRRLRKARQMEQEERRSRVTPTAVRPPALPNSRRRPLPTGQAKVLPAGRAKALTA